MSCESIKSLCCKLWLVMLLWGALCVWPVGSVRAVLPSFTVSISVVDEHGPINDAEVTIIRKDGSAVKLDRDADGHYSKKDVTLDPSYIYYIYNVKAHGHESVKQTILIEQFNSALQHENNLNLPQISLKSTSASESQNVSQQTSTAISQTLGTGNTASGQTATSNTNSPPAGTSVGATLSVQQWLLPLLGLLFIFGIAGLAWRAGYLHLPQRHGENVGGNNVVSSDDKLNRLIQTVEVLKEKQKDILSEQQDLQRLVRDLDKRLPKPAQPQPKSATPAPDQISTRTADAWPTNDAHANPPLNGFTNDHLELQAQIIDEPVQTRMRGGGPVPEEVEKLYNNLVRGEAVSPDPIYLNAEAKASMTEVYEDSNVYLQEVNTTQGAFVLFTGFNQQSWVFPNPQMPYRQKALKPVFPELSEAEFHTHVTPKQVSPLEGGRWKIVTGQ